MENTSKLPAAQVQLGVKVSRPWGTYESVHAGSSHQVKHIMVNPGAKLSLQLHLRRSEHWIVVAGRALVTVGDKQMVVLPNESTFISMNCKHRLENTSEEPLHLIEV